MKYFWLLGICLFAFLSGMPPASCQSGSSAPAARETTVQETRLYPFRSAANGKIGYLSDQGKIAIAPQFTDCESVNPGPEFSGGLAITGCVPLGYIDATGKTVIPPVFDDVKPFSQGLAAVKKAGQKWGYINTSAAFVIAPRFEEAGSFSEGLAPVLNDDGEWTYIDRAGRVQISSPFEKAGAFSLGLAPVQVNGKFGYVNKSGNVAIPAQFKEARPFSDGFAAVLTDSWHYITPDGKLAFPTDFAEAGEFSAGLAPVQLKENSPFGYIDRTGTFRLQPRFARAFRFKSGLALVYFSIQPNPKGENRRNLQYGYIDKNGRTLFSGEIPYIQSGGARGVGSEGQAYIPMSPVSIESTPSGAKVYLIPLDDWESDRSIETEGEKLLRYLQSEYTPLRDYRVIQQVYRVFLELNGKRAVRQFDVNKFSPNRLLINFEKE